MDEVEKFVCEDHNPKVKEIVQNFEGNGLLLERAKSIVKIATLPQELLEIFSQYRTLVSLVEKLENPLYSIKDAYTQISSLEFGDDLTKIKAYIFKRLHNFEKTDIHQLIEISPDKEHIPSATYALLQNCQATTAAVERSFSMLKKILAKDRNFLPQNVHKYIVLHYNLASTA